MASVGKAYAVLTGRLTGDEKKAKEFLESMSPEERTIRNRTESRRRSRKKKFRMGYGR